MNPGHSNPALLKEVFPNLNPALLSRDRCRLKKKATSHEQRTFNTFSKAQMDLLHREFKKSKIVGYYCIVS